MHYFVFVLLISSLSSAMVVPTNDFARSKPWLKLLHFKESGGGHASQADGDDFFLSKTGKNDPTAELEASVKAFYATSPLDDTHAQCRFPARLLLLVRELKLQDLPTPRCGKFQKFREAVAARSASIVFSSYYLNNPASAFGHTMLRLNKTDGAKGEKRFELLDNGINFGAEVTTQNALVYALYGLTGLFQGTFTRVPYFYKVREYNDFESRDLWEYDLNLTSDQLELLVAHIWELGSTYFDYYYLTENCSYHLNSTLEAVLPELELTEPLPFYVIPGDTIRLLVQTPGLIRDVHFRPSQRTQFKKRIEPLGDRQLDALDQIVGRRDPTLLAADFTTKEKVQVLDAAIDYVDLKHFKELLREPAGNAGQWKQELLIARSRINEPTPDLKITIPQNEKPHVGHESARAGIESGYAEGKGAFTGVNARFALHDLLDPRAGYPSYAQIEFGHVRLRYHPSGGEFQLDDFTLFRVISLSPVTRFSREMSWKVKVSLSTIRDFSCENCLAGGFEVGAGLAHELFEGVTGFLMMDNETYVSPKFDSFWAKMGIGPSLGVKIALGDRLAMLLNGAYRFQFPTADRHGFLYGAGLRWAFSSSLALDAGYRRYSRNWEASGGFYYYF